MKIRIAATVSTFAMLLACAWPAQGQSCNDQLIQGTYGFTIEGQKLGPPNTPIGPQVGVAMTTFDGRGGLTQTDTVTINGELVADFTHATAGGNYQVNADCTGTFTILFHDGRPPATVNFVVTENGNEIDTVVIFRGGPGVLATRSTGRRTFTRQSGE
jgi:hypothetical protein